MKDEKRIKAEILLESIGEIDDSFLAEAMSYRPRRRSSSKVLILAATLALVFTMTVGVFMVSRLTGEKASGDMGESGNENAKAECALDSLLTSIDDREEYDYIKDTDSLPYFDGMAYVVWQYSGDDGYYVSDALTESELDEFKSDIGKGSSVGTRSPSLECKVWVLLGDGRVISPYLEGSAGNISNTVFDYEAEILPAEKVVVGIEGILG